MTVAETGSFIRQSAKLWTEDDRNNFVDFIASNPASKSRYPSRCVITLEISSPDSSSTVILYQVSYISRP